MPKIKVTRRDFEISDDIERVVFVGFSKKLYGSFREPL